MKKAILLSFIGLGLFVTSQKNIGQCIADTNNVYTFEYEGNHYEIVKEKLNWVNAAACAVIRGGFLAEINTEEEQDTIFYHLKQAGITVANTVAPDGGGASYVWIGGNDLETEGVWVWDGDNEGDSVQFWQGTGATGSAVNEMYKNWGSSNFGKEPDDWNGQDALGLAITDWPLGKAGQWNDVKHTNMLYYVIEYLDDHSGIDEITEEIPVIHLFPNPGSGTITITIPDGWVLPDQSFIKVYSLSGGLQKILEVESNPVKADLKELSDGIYFVKFEKAGFVSKPVRMVVVR